MRKLTLLAAAILLAACSKDINNGDAVKQGVLDYLQQRKTQTGLDMTLMQIDVVSVAFEKDKAKAVVMFRPKNMADAAGMQMAYTLDRKGNKWVVEGHGESDGGSNPHGGGAMQGMPGAPQGMPPGHPGVGAMPGGEGAAPGAMPPGHPPMSPKQ